MAANQPKSFGKYILLDQMAVGGMAELYRAMITGVQGFEKLIAIKKILPHLASEEELISSFIDEAKLAALLHHQNIVQIYDFGSLDNSYFIAMEYLFGKNLRLITQKSVEKNLPLPLADALFIVSRICSGLDYAHTLKDFQGKPLNIIHRDISPPNILVTYEGSVKIVDFGIAKAANQTTMTQLGMVKGKVAYMSPEQAAGKIIDNRSDIFSCGILLYELVTGKRMFEGETLHILSHVRDCVFVAAESIDDQLPQQLIEILHKALAKDPADRYATCSEMEADLEECMYANAMRPTAHGLSDYLKKLFADEITAEETLIKELTELGATASAAEPTQQKKEKKWQNKVKKSYEHLAESGKKQLDSIKTQNEKKNPVLLYGGIAATVVVLIALFAIFSGDDKPVEPQQVVQSPAAETNVAEPAPAAPEPEPAPVEAVPEPPPPAEPTKLVIAVQTLKEKGFELALPLFEEIWANENERSADVALPYSQALTEKATAIVESEPQVAEKILTLASEINPDNVAAFEQLGRLYMMMDDYPMAVVFYNQATNLAPDHPGPFFALGYIYGINREYAKAEEMYNQVVELEPEYLDDALFNLAAIQLQQGKKDTCIENLKKALSINPENSSAQKLLEKLTPKSGG